MVTIDFATVGHNSVRVYMNAFGYGDHLVRAVLDLSIWSYSRHTKRRQPHATTFWLTLNCNFFDLAQLPQLFALQHLNAVAIRGNQPELPELFHVAGGVDRVQHDQTAH